MFNNKELESEAFLLAGSRCLLPCFVVVVVVGVVVVVVVCIYWYLYDKKNISFLNQALSYVLFPQIQIL